MLSKLMPKEGRFFYSFNALAAKILDGCVLFKKMLNDFGDLETYSVQIRKIEHDCDEITHQVIDMVNKVFITPVDREDIQELVKTMDDVMDLVNYTTQCMHTYEIHSVPPGLNRMAQVLIQAAEAIESALKAMATMRKPEETLTHCIEINRLENECDAILRECIGVLFREHKDDALLVIKYKEIYESIEKALDSCEDVANVIEQITIKHS